MVSTRPMTRAWVMSALVLLLLCVAGSAVASQARWRPYSPKSPFSSVGVRVRRGLGEGCPGSSQELALAELLQGGGAGAAFLRAHVRRTFESLFRSAVVVAQEHPAPEGYNPADEDPLDTADRSQFEATLQAAASVLGPHVPALLVPELSLSSVDVSQMLDVLPSNHTVLDAVSGILASELSTRRMMDAARSSVRRRLLEVRQRHLLQLEQLLAVDTAATLQDALVVQETHRNMTGARAEMGLRARARARSFAQMRNSLLRLQQAESTVLRAAGRFVINTVMSKAAIHEDSVARFVLEIVQVLSNDGEGAEHAIRVGRRMVQHSYELNRREAKFLSALGAVTGAVSLVVDRTAMEFFRDTLMAANAQGYTNLALSVAMARRLARIISRRALRELRALHDTADIIKEAAAVREVDGQRAIKLLREQEVFVAADITGAAYNIFDERPFNFTPFLLPGKPLPSLSARPTFVAMSDRISKVTTLLARHVLDDPWTLPAPPVPVTHDDFERVERLARAVEFSETAAADLENARDSFRVGKDAVASTYLASGIFNSGLFLRLPDRLQLPTPSPAPAHELAEERRLFGGLSVAPTKKPQRVFRLGARGRIFRHGVANDAKPLNHPVQAVRSRLERLQWVASNRTLPGRFSRFTRQLLRGRQDAELLLAKAVARVGGELTLKLQRDRINLFRFMEGEDGERDEAVDYSQSNSTLSMDRLLEEIALGNVDPDDAHDEHHRMDVEHLDLVPRSPLSRLSVDGALLRNAKANSTTHGPTRLQLGEDLTRAGIEAIRQITAGFLSGGVGGLSAVTGGVAAIAQSLPGPIGRRLRRIVRRVDEMAQRPGRGARRALGAAVNSGAISGMRFSRQVSQQFDDIASHRRAARAHRVAQLFQRRTRDEAVGVFRPFSERELHDLRLFEREQVSGGDALAMSLARSAGMSNIQQLMQRLQ